MTALLYTRVSTDHQDTLRQDTLIDAYLLRAGLTLANPLTDRYSDPDTSGSIAMHARPGGAALLTRLDTAPPTALVTTEQDRLGRDLLDIVATIRRLWDHGHTPHFAVEGGPILRTPETELIMGVRASTAQYERDKIRQRIRGKLSALRSAGQRIGTIPYGWDCVLRTDGTQHLLPNPTEQYWLGCMTTWRAAGWSLSAIARELNRLGAPTKTPPGTPICIGHRPDGTRILAPCRGTWQVGNVARTLRNSTTQAWLQSLGLARRTATAAPT